MSVAHGEARLTVGATPEQMIDAADKAMYARKRERRGEARLGRGLTNGQPNADVDAPPNVRC